MRKLLVAMALISGLSSLALGDIAPSERTMRWNWSLQTRYTASSDISGDYGVELALADDLGWGFGFDYNFNERFSLGCLISWRSISYNAKYFDAGDLINPLYYSGWLDTGAFAMVGQVNLLPKAITPYVNGTAGWTLIDTNIAASYEVGCWWDPWWGYICDEYTSNYGTEAFSYGFGAGLRFETAQKLFIQAGYEMNFLDLEFTDASAWDIFRVDVGFGN